MKKLILTMLLIMSMQGSNSLANGIEAISISREDMAGGIFEGIPEKDFFGNRAQSANSYTSGDGRFGFGAFRWTVKAEENATYKYESFPHNEYMYFLQGGMRLVAEDGKVTEAGTGEVIFIPKGWSGTRTMFDAMKLAVVYQGEAAPGLDALSISKEELAGSIFEGVPRTEVYGNPAQLVTGYKSVDKQFSFAVFRWSVENETKGIVKIEDYPFSEYMYFLEGGMRVVDENGRETKAGPGEVLFIPKGWSGTHYTGDMKKIAVVYGELPEH